jgi:general stress protein 26
VSSTVHLTNAADEEQAMDATEPTVELDERFSEPDALPPSWSGVLAVLNDAEMFWLSTVRGDGRPHVTPIPAVWHDGALHICTGSLEQKAENLTRDPRCILTTGTDRLRSGLDVVVEGAAVRVLDQAVLRTLASIWLDKLDWPFEVTDTGFSDGDGRVALVFRVAPEKVLAFGKAPFTQTRYRFADRA